MSVELKAPLVSVVITSYNYAQYIGEALESVSSQTYRPLECIVVDDCSTDNSPEVIQNCMDTLKAKNDGIDYAFYSTPKNSGQLSAFQLGIQKAHGVFINFLDADDFLFPDFVAAHVQVHLDNMVSFTFNEPIEIDDKKQVHCFHSNTGNAYKKFSGASSEIKFLSFSQFSESLKSLSLSDTILDLRRNIIDRNQIAWNRWYWYPTSSALFRKSAINDLCYENDVDSWRICADCLLFVYANIIGNSCFVPRQLSAYRRHGKNGFAGDMITGAYRYLPDASKNTAARQYEKLLPLSLLKIFSSDQDNPLLRTGFMKNVIYKFGAGFLLKNWNKVFSYFSPLSFSAKLFILLKTVIRHWQYESKVRKFND